MGYREDMDDLRQEERQRERLFQQEQQQRERQTLRTRAQWREIGKMVIVHDEEAVKTIMTRAGILLRLYCEDQTRERTQQELERDAWRG